MKPLCIGLFLFNEVEVLDFAGPFEVFSLSEKDGEKVCKVVTISEDGKLISGRNGLKVQPDFSFYNHPKLDILLIPGGFGAENIEIKNPAVLQWIREEQKQVKTLASICTGAFLLAEIGLLNGKKATTHWMDLELLEKTYLDIEVVRNVKYVDEGDVLTSGGISAGIHLSFHILERLFGTEIVQATAKRMEYDL